MTEIGIVSAFNVVGGVAEMFRSAPVDWWRFVPCGTCNAKRQDLCVMGGGRWPEPARRPHQVRIQSARVLHGTLWLIAAGHLDDVFGPSNPSPEQPR